MQDNIIRDSGLSKFLFSDKRSALLWLPVRLYVGYEWLIAGWHKVVSEDWVGWNAGTPLSKFVTGALSKTAGAHPDVQGWYGDFLTNAVSSHPALWSNIVSYGELLVGIALIIGAFTGIAAFFGLFMNLNYLLAGTVSTNPILFTLSIGLVLAWRVAGYIGLDALLIRMLGAPWQWHKSD